MFVFNFSKETLKEAISGNNYSSISKNLFRVQKISSTGYLVVYRHHLATTIENESDMKGFSTFNNFDGIKLSINCLGSII